MSYSDGSLIEVTPTLAANNIANGAEVYPVLASKRAVAPLTARVFGADSPDVAVGQHCPAIEGAGRVAGPGPALSLSVENVIVVRAEEEMLRAYATGIVANVENMHPVGNRPEVQLPRDAVGGGDSSTSHADLPVAVCAQRCGPFPALAGAVNLRPETAFEGRGSGILMGHIWNLLTRDFGVPCLGMFHHRRGFRMPQVYQLTRSYTEFGRAAA